MTAAYAQTLALLVGKFFGSEIILVSEKTRDDGWTEYRLKQVPAPGEIILGDPNFLVSTDGETIFWGTRGSDSLPFTLKDLAEADPTIDVNRHPTTRRLAARLRSVMTDKAPLLLSLTGSIALVVALTHRRFAAESAALLVASATDHDYWALCKQSWGFTTPPFTADEMKAADDLLITETWLMDEIHAHGMTFLGWLRLPTLANKRFCAYDKDL